MTAVNITAIGIEENRLLIGAERPLLDFAVSRREKFWRAARRRNCVKMLPAILLAGKNNAILRCPMNHAATGIVRHVGERILQLRSAVPDLFRVRRFRVGHEDCPGMRAIRLNEISLRSVARNGWLPDERQLLATRGPRGIR